MSRRDQRFANDMSPRELRRLIARLSANQPLSSAFERELCDKTLRKTRPWYSTQKEHWLGWLDEYEGPGAYGRLNWNRTARFVYNHVACPPMLAWLAEAVGLPPHRVRCAIAAAERAGDASGSQSSAFRRIVDWDEIEQSLNGGGMRKLDRLV